MHPVLTSEWTKMIGKKMYKTSQIKGGGMRFDHSEGKMRKLTVKDKSTAAYFRMQGNISTSESFKVALN